MEGDYIGVFTASDTFKDSYRDHTNRRILAVNKVNARPLGRSLQIGNGARVIKWSNLFQKKIGYRVEERTDNFKDYELRDSLVGPRTVFYVGHGDSNGGTAMCINLHLSPKSLWSPSPLGFKIGKNAAITGNTGLPNGSLKNLQLAIFLSCSTGKFNTNPVYVNAAGDEEPGGSIIDEVVAKGAGTAVGWTVDVNRQWMNVYAFYLWESLCRGNRKTDHVPWRNTSFIAKEAKKDNATVTFPQDENQVPDIELLPNRIPPGGEFESALWNVGPKTLETALRNADFWAAQAYSRLASDGSTTGYNTYRWVGNYAGNVKISRLKKVGGTVTSPVPLTFQPTKWP